MRNSLSVWVDDGRTCITKLNKKLAQNSDQLFFFNLIKLKTLHFIGLSNVMEHLLLVLLLSLHTHVSARSSGGGYACNDATASLCSLDCPNNNQRAWATYQSNDILSPCCPAGMDMVAPPTRNKGYRIYLKGVGQVVRPFFSTVFKLEMI